MNIDDKWTAIALLYGPPKPLWHTSANNYPVSLEWRMALEKVFNPENVKRVGLIGMAQEYADWYYVNGKQAGEQHD